MVLVTKLGSMVEMAEQFREFPDYALVAVYEFGEAYGTLEDLEGFHISAARKMGKLVNIDFQYNEWIIQQMESSPTILYKYYENAPKKDAFRRRKFLKQQLGKHKSLFGIARRQKTSYHYITGEKKSPKTQFEQILTKEQKQFLSWRFGSWENFYKIARNTTKYVKLPSEQHKTLDNFFGVN